MLDSLTYNTLVKSILIIFSCKCFIFGLTRLLATIQVVFIGGSEATVLIRLEPHLMSIVWKRENFSLIFQLLLLLRHGVHEVLIID